MIVSFWARTLRCMNLQLTWAARSAKNKWITIVISLFCVFLSRSFSLSLYFSLSLSFSFSLSLSHTHTLSYSISFFVSYVFPHYPSVSVSVNCISLFPPPFLLRLHTLLFLSHIIYTSPSFSVYVPVAPADVSKVCSQGWYCTEQCSPEIWFCLNSKWYITVLFCYFFNLIWF